MPKIVFHTNVYNLIKKNRKLKRSRFLNVFANFQEVLINIASFLEAVFY